MPVGIHSGRVDESLYEIGGCCIGGLDRSRTQKLELSTGPGVDTQRVGKPVVELVVVVGVLIQNSGTTVKGGLTPQPPA